MNTTEINWRQNCLTVGIHDGRPEELWNLPLLQAASTMFAKDELKELVIARIYSDAMQFVEYGAEPRQSKEWAEKIKIEAEKAFDNTLKVKVGEIVRYYHSPSHHRDLQDATERFEQGKLNPGYAPRHPHDTINMLCRIIGTSASWKASQ